MNEDDIDDIKDFCIEYLNKHLMTSRPDLWSNKVYINSIIEDFKKLVELYKKEELVKSTELGKLLYTKEDK